LMQLGRMTAVEEPGIEVQRGVIRVMSTSAVQLRYSRSVTTYRQASWLIRVGWPLLLRFYVVCYTPSCSSQRRYVLYLHTRRRRAVPTVFTSRLRFLILFNLQILVRLGQQWLPREWSGDERIDRAEGRERLNYQCAADPAEWVGLTAMGDLGVAWPPCC
jgi:hypothetical protein